SWRRRTAGRYRRTRRRLRPSRAALLRVSLSDRTRAWRQDQNAWPEEASINALGRRRIALPAQFARVRKVGLLGRQRLLLQRQAEPVPDLQQRFREPVDQAVVVVGRGRDPQALGSLGDRRIIDRLDVD